MEQESLPAEILARLPNNPKLGRNAGQEDISFAFPRAFFSLLESNTEPDPQALELIRQFRSECRSALLNGSSPDVDFKLHACDIILSPLRHVPDEILREVFLRAVNKSSTRWNTIAQVCARWKHVATSLPEFWSTTSFKFTEETEFDEVMARFSNHVELSRRALLDISVETTLRAGTPVAHFHNFINTILSDTAIATRVGALTITSRDIHHKYKYDLFSLPNLKSLRIHDGPLMDDFEIEFSDAHLSRYEEETRTYGGQRQQPHPPRPAIFTDWMGSFLPPVPATEASEDHAPDLGLASTFTRQISQPILVSFGIDACKSLLNGFNGAVDAPWSKLTHIFLQPVFSEDGWWSLMRECDSLIMGWFNVTQQWEEYDPRSPTTCGCSNVEDLTVAFVDYQEPSQHCIKTLSDSSFPHLKTFALHLNEGWATYGSHDTEELNKEMPLLERISLPRSWSMCGTHWTFLRHFSHLRHVELGIRLSRLNRSLKVLTLPSPPTSTSSTVAEAPKPVLATEKETKPARADGDPDGSPDEDEEDEDEEESEEDQPESDEDSDDSSTARKPPKQPFLTSMETLTLEINDLTPARYTGRSLSNRHVEPLIAMVKSRTQEDILAFNKAARLTRLEVSFMKPETKRTRSYAYMWSDKEESSEDEDDKTDQKVESEEEEDTDEYERSERILDIIRTRLQPYIDGGLSLEVDIREHARSSYIGKWEEAQRTL